MTDLPIENRTNKIMFVGLDWHSNSETKIFITDESNIENTPILPGEAIVLDITTNVGSITLRRKKQKQERPSNQEEVMEWKEWAAEIANETKK